MTTRQIVLRSIVCSMGLGFGWGTLAGAVILSIDNAYIAGPFDYVGIMVISAFYGGPLGGIVGLVLGMPTVLMVYPLRLDLSRCRRVGAAWAAALPGIGAVGLAVTGGEAVDGAIVLGVFTVAVAVSAWIGLGWILRPAVQHAS